MLEAQVTAWSFCIVLQPPAMPTMHAYSLAQRRTDTVCKSVLCGLVLQYGVTRGPLLIKPVQLLNQTSAALMPCHCFCAGVVRAEGSAPLLRHLFAAAVQPVLQSVHSWAFLPDMQAAEAAAEVTAMASFTAGSGSSSSNPLSSGCTVGAAFSSHDTAAAAAAVAAGGPFASASQLVGAPPRNSSGGGAGGGSSKGWNGSKAAESAMRQCLQQAWHSVCARPPGCPRFLAHVQRPAGVAGMQLHLLQLLGGPGQALANRLGWLAELEQQEIQEALCAGSTAAAAHSGKVAAARTCSTPAPVAGSFMGLLSGFGPCAGDAHVSAGVRPAGQRPMCDLTSSQLKQVRTKQSREVARCEQCTCRVHLLSA